MKLQSSEEPILPDSTLYHIRCKKGDIAPYVLLPGDPSRVPKIASFWDEAREIVRHREYVTYTGKYKGVPISATSTGIGGPSTAIAIEELARVGANTFIRVGSTGALQPDIRVGDLIISTASIRFDGVTKIYVYPEYPAVAHYEVVLALIEAAESLGVKYHVGITASTDSFYVGQGRKGFKGYMPKWCRGIVDELREMNVLNFEMESSTIFTLSNLYGLRAGGVYAVYDNAITGEFVAGAGEEDAIRVACEAVKILYEWDRAKSNKSKKYFYPSLVK